jgi:uncharacterized protein YyaL (SSP411 family)
MNPALTQQISEELRSQTDAPRTHHLREDGSAKFANRLALESSPYLLQHAHNPVDWYPWGPEAFEAARALDRPIFLSVGYSTCHWCHVMEEESFEDLEIAQFINEHFIPIKVDREERPDVDGVYMAAVQALTGRGGWPMTVLMTPDLQPFFGGTYFPPRDGVRGARVGLLTLLQQMSTSWNEDGADLVIRAQQITRHIQQQLEASWRTGDVPGPDIIEACIDQYRTQYDDRYGGLNRQHKFPSSLPIRTLLRHHRRTGDPSSLQMATQTLDAMASGGMYDQLGGGFHRYSTDVRWHVPHFEKMLYDNALLVLAYLDGWQVTKRPVYERIVRETLQDVQNNMTAPDGAFYSATDADSLDPEGERVEGAFFGWTPEEVVEILGPTDGPMLNAWYGVTPAGHLDGLSVLTRHHELQTFCAKRGLDEEDTARRIQAGREALLEVRSRRPPPLRDDKVLAAWNGLMIEAYARAGLVLNEPQYTEIAVRAGHAVRDRLWRDGLFHRSHLDDKPRHRATLEDHAFLASAWVSLFEATQDPQWLDEALRHHADLTARYADPVGGWFLTPNDGEKLIAREKPSHDGAIPSGNSVHARTLLRLSALKSDAELLASSEEVMRAFSGRLSKNPSAIPLMVDAIDQRWGRPLEVVVVAEDPAEAAAFRDAYRTRYLPDSVWVYLPSSGGSDDHPLPLAQGKRSLDGHTTGYVCERGVCQQPTQDIEAFAAQLDAHARPRQESP